MIFFLINLFFLSYKVAILQVKENGLCNNTYVWHFWNFLTVLSSLFQDGWYCLPSLWPGVLKLSRGTVIAWVQLGTLPLCYEDRFLGGTELNFFFLFLKRGQINLRTSYLEYDHFCKLGFLWVPFSSALSPPILRLLWDTFHVIKFAFGLGL